MLMLKTSWLKRGEYSDANQTPLKMFKESRRELDLIPEVKKKTHIRNQLKME